MPRPRYLNQKLRGTALDSLEKNERFFVEVVRQIRSFQKDFRDVVGSFALFREALGDMAVRQLQNGFDPPRGGLCKTCRAIEKGSI